MSIGMMWFDNSKDDLPTKLDRAVAYYRGKYQQVPNKCYVHKSMMKKRRGKINGMNIIASPIILNNHIWIGREVQSGG